MASPRPMRIRFLTLICVAVCTVATALGWVAGAMGTYLYAHDLVMTVTPALGGWIGACSALASAIVWARCIVPLSLYQVSGLRSMAGLVGLGAGVLGAVLLHAGLMIAASEVQLKALAVGLGMIAPAGLIMGLFAGHLCRLAVTTERAYRSHRPEGRMRRPIPFDGPLPVPDPMEQLDVRTCFHPRPNFRDEYDA
ncbi:MAG TPA: hypothetical protein PLQ89_15570 [Phycisphaerae bacterium]|nr:hypothetical protein [Phycisphaerae bacterium]HOM49673.1 hypothetical protein [Phycisphaerae bacterium]HOQ87131.1 hypothetical protein [Phycisphaerae bacterium]HPP25042.1 hypothetical protein [Phycisphaerae bacterium]HPZ99509.1 hypothetical protein [Phycisphaerae bacterium]